MQPTIEECDIIIMDERVNVRTLEEHSIIGYAHPDEEHYVLHRVHENTYQTQLFGNITTVRDNGNVKDGYELYRGHIEGVAVYHIENPVC